MLQVPLGTPWIPLAVAALLSSMTPRRAIAQQDTTTNATIADSATLADSVRQVTRWLVANGAPTHRATAVADAVMQYARLRALDPLLIVGVIGVENATLAPRARSRAGARGVMQVMPAWRRDIKGCGNDLHDVRVNVCFGTAILRIALDASSSVREALARYNGCLHTSGCSTYVSAVFGRAGYALLASRQMEPSARAPNALTLQDR